jgi:hypothetical protein
MDQGISDRYQGIRIRSAGHITNSEAFDQKIAGHGGE